MALQLYDLAGAEPDRRFSPYCWRTKLALMHKGLAFETIPWRFTEKDAIAFSGQGRVPVLRDGDRVVFDSWTIATYLENHYRDHPYLFRGDGGRVVTRFVNAWADTILVGGILPLVVTDILAHLHDRDRAYFRETREKRLGATLESVSANREIDILTFRKSLQPVRALLATQSYFCGETPAYADYAVLGCFQWARCISPFSLLLKDDPIWAWRDRLLAAFDGLARNASGYPGISGAKAHRHTSAPVDSQTAPDRQRDMQRISVRALVVNALARLCDVRSLYPKTERLCLCKRAPISQI